MEKNYTIIENPWEYSRTIYYSFSIEQDGSEYFWTLVWQLDEMDYYPTYTINWNDLEPDVDEDKLISKLTNILEWNK